MTLEVGLPVALQVHAFDREPSLDRLLQDSRRDRLLTVPEKTHSGRIDGEDLAAHPSYKAPPLPGVTR